MKKLFKNFPIQKVLSPIKSEMLQRNLPRSKMFLQSKCPPGARVWWKSLSNQNVFRISLGARFRLGATHRPGRFWDPFLAKILKNDRFYKGLAPNGGWNLPPPAGLRPASPVSPKKLPRRIFESKKGFCINNVFFESKVF